MHATDDTVVPASQSTAMAIALGEAGQNARFIKLAGEDHWLSKSATRVQVLKEIEQFLGTNLRAEP
jgi:dipeptidyl aminopeptidase/acylaminoacyl peptidase